MTFKELQAAMIAAMKEKNRVKKDVISDMISCAKNMAIEQGADRENVPEEIVTVAILKSKKVCQEQIDTCPANRPDILEAYHICMNYINEFAPKMMTYEEVFALVKAEVTRLMSAGVEISPKIKGTLMKYLVPKLKGKADGKTINQVVTDILNEGAC